MSADRLASRILAAWTRQYFAKPLVPWALGLGLAAYLIGLACLGPAPSTKFADDIFLMLDGGWRILNGLVPYRDFDLALGPLTYMLVATGLWITHYDAYGLVIGLLLFAAIVTPLAFFISRSRMTAAGSILFSSFILLLCTSPMPLGESSSVVLSYAMIYNRFGYALLGIIYAAQLLPRRHDDSSVSHDASHLSKDWLANVATGAAVTGLLFLKLSYFGVGGGLVLLAILADPRNVRRMAGIALGAAAALFIMFGFLRFEVTAFIHNCLNAIHARAGNVSHISIAELFGINTTLFIAMLISFCFSDWTRTNTRRRIFVILAGLYTILSEALLVRTNAFQGLTFPLYGIFIFVLLAAPGTSYAKHHVSRQYSASMLVIGLSLVLPLFYTNLASVALLVHYKTSGDLKTSAQRVQGAHLQSLAFYDALTDKEAVRLENGHFYTLYLNDAINLLRKFSNDSELVTTVGFHNPFSYALLRKPPRGGNTWFLLGNNVAMDRLPSNDRMFGDATFVLVPKHPSTHFSSDETIYTAYKPYLTSNFSLVTESEWWLLYRRANALARSD